MIGYITGRVVYSEPPILLIVTSQGLGYEVETPLSLVDTPISQELSLYTHHHIREDQQKLFGFQDIDSRNLFRILIKTSGVGPKSAMALLSHKDATSIVNAILQKQPEQLSGIKGLGKKLIEKIIIECQPSLKNWHTCITTPQDTSNSQMERDAIAHSNNWAIFTSRSNGHSKTPSRQQLSEYPSAHCRRSQKGITKV